MSKLPAVPSADLVLGDLLRRVAILEAVTPGAALIVTAEAFSSSAALHLAAPVSGVFSMQHDSGDTLLDYTSPMAPSVIADGVYSVSGTVVSSGCATPDYFDMKLGVDSTPLGRTGLTAMFAEGRGYAPAVSTPYMKVSVAGVWPMSAGDVIAVTVISGTALTVDFEWQDGTIVKLA